MHLTLNTLVRQDELHAALKVAEEACVLGVDALIVQDVGLARRIRTAAPGLALHASTQLSCHTPSGVRFLRDSGFSRVVLAREMSRTKSPPVRGRAASWRCSSTGAVHVRVGAMLSVRHAGRAERQPGTLRPALSATLCPGGQRATRPGGRRRPSA